jgi:adenylate cyclase
MLHGRALVRTEATRVLDLLAVLALATATAFLAGRQAPVLSLLAILLGLAGWAVLSQLAFTRAQLWLAGVAPAVAVVATGIAVETLRLAEERRRRRALERQRTNLGRYFPPTVVERLAASDAPRDLDRTHEATVMFVDLVGFTRTAETLSPAAAMGLLRGFHTLVERIVFAHHGMVDKFIGDGVMACFGVPDPTPAAPADALRCAFDLLAALDRPVEAGDGTAHSLKVGMGIHRGPVLMGDVGGATQLQFTVVGDAVNVASRLEALTRSSGTALIASDAVVVAARPHLEPARMACLERLPDATLRGRQEAVAIWRLAKTPGSMT